MTAQSTHLQGLVGRRLALVESMLHDVFYDGIIRAVEAGVDVHLLIRDRDWYGDARAWQNHPLGRVARLSVVDTHSVEAVVAAVTDSAGRPLVDGITTFSDYHTEIAAQAAERLGLPSPAAAAVRTANQKPLLRQLLDGLPYNVPHVLVTDANQLADAATRLGYPLVAKPPAEAISHGVVLVNDEIDLRAAYAQLSGLLLSLRGQPRPGHVLLEKYIEGPEFSVESLTVGGVTGFYGVTAKKVGPPPGFLETEHSFPAELDPGTVTAVLHTVGSVLTRLGYRQGPAHTEVRLSPDGPKVVEVNPRAPAGNLTTMLMDVCGRDLQLDAMLLAVGGRPPLPTGPEPGSGAAVVMLYPPGAAEVLDGIDGLPPACTAGLRATVFARPGDELWPRVDNGARVGLIYAMAADPATALSRARAAARQVTIRTRPRRPAATTAGIR
ncbi:MAG TPA: ATP-grasp domain-containing protein [Nakamurella sp.]